MIWFFTPYSFEGKLFEAYDQYMSLIRDTDDWVVFSDGDTLFFHSDFGHMVRDYTEKYPDTGMFTCFTNRIGTKSQLYNKELFEIDSIKYNFLIAEHIRSENYGKATKTQLPVSGFFIAIRHRTWMAIKEELKLILRDKQILDVDYALSNLLLAKGYTIRRIDNLLILHYYRFVEGNPSNRGIK
jgi:cellulose synthase/poly-beta-1,6-N-acetylglucosamine synthase-like glycosyltransferase